jgi:hypothetical protein
MNPCPLCGQRRARRACPAVGATICAVCCGTKRLREIACPADCGYLSAAREHPAAVVQRRQEQDARFYAPIVGELSEPQYRLLLLFQAVSLKVAEGAMPPLRDDDVADAANAVASTLETAEKGILYEHRAGSLPARLLADELSAAIDEVSRSERRPRTLKPDAVAALRRLRQGALDAASAMPGDDPPVFLGLMRRMMAAVAETTPRADAPAPPQRIIIP